MGDLTFTLVCFSTNGDIACVRGNNALAEDNNWEVSNCAIREFSICQKPEGKNITISVRIHWVSTHLYL